MPKNGFLSYMTPFGLFFKKGEELLTMEKLNDFLIRVATVNGSGSQSSNNILFRTLFYMGIPVAGKNIFPSNIAGLPTWYNIRVSKDGYVGHKKDADVLVLLNSETFAEDVAEAKPGSVVVFEEKLARPNMPQGLIYYPIPFQKLIVTCCEEAKLRKLVINMIYVGSLAALLEIDLPHVRHALEKQFKSKPKAVELNWKAIQAGFDYVKKNIQKKDPCRVKPMDKTRGKILITGNESAGLGCLFGGCTVFSWYPITPASSLGESVVDYFAKYRRSAGEGRANFAVVQAEDELAALGMAIGAGWAGARSATSTSGPGISLMAEFAGLAYFAEIPVVVFDVQRLGPSTGLPTRTSQGDIIFTQFLSHGDTKHLALIPSTPEECFDFAQEAFDLADEFQTLVFVLSDLDLGMNNWMSDAFEYREAPFRRGKVLTKEALDKISVFHRYADVDGDGACWRTLPGTAHMKAAYFTRGSGHTPQATYSEKSQDWQTVLDRIAKKIENAKQKAPQPVVEKVPGAKAGIVAYGSTHAALVEARDLLAAKGLKTNYLRIRSLPLNGKIEAFIKECEHVYVVEQNQQGQMANLMKMEYPAVAGKLRPVLHYNGMPADAETIVESVMRHES